jgi:maltooligosyltrehalose trehalohydrolase
MTRTVGAHMIGPDKAEFTIWAPLLDQLKLHITQPKEQMIDLKKDDQGYWTAIVDEVKEGARYLYSIGEESQWPDPASFYQPDDIFKASAVVDHKCYPWRVQDWKGFAL